MTTRVRTATGILTVMALFAAGAASLVAQAPQGAPPGPGRGRGPQSPPLLSFSNLIGCRLRNDGSPVGNPLRPKSRPTTPATLLTAIRIPSS